MKEQIEVLLFYSIHSIHSVMKHSFLISPFVIHPDSECGQSFHDSELDGSYDDRARKERSQEEHNGHSVR